MNTLQAVILGIVQGFTEFLPVSSSGHLVLLQSLFGIEEATMTFDVVLHLGTLVPVCIVFWQEIFAIIKKPFQKLTYLLIVATIPAVIVTLLLGDTIDGLFSGTKYLAFGFIITGILLILADRIKGGSKTEKEMTYVDAIIIGCVQGVAIAPGISRSGSTITGSLFRKLNRETAAKFSFLMSIPAILGAAVLQVKDIATGEVALESIHLLNFSAGFIAAALSGYLAIRFMLKLVKKAKLKYFSFYVFILAAILLVQNYM